MTKAQRILIDMQGDYWLAIDVETMPTDIDWLIIQILDSALIRMGYTF